ncbi:MAG TPA: hypothetical protein VMI54_11240 [Polyangiaceae bacterium]|nr:hypothetical protein [Polyangiaceae bacterium]
MRHSWTAMLLLCGSFALAYGCGGDDTNPPTGNAGKGGQAGTAGHGGTSAGHAGTGGTGGGKAGSGGTGGTAGGFGGGGGRGGAGGKGGVGGTAGSAAGSAGGGAGGEAGLCADEVSRHKLAQCASVSTADGPLDTIQTTCSFAATCDALKCGEVSSPFDASGCRRQDCTSSASCGANERCFAPPLAGVFGCFQTAVEGCAVADGCTCSCSAVETCDPAAYCLPASEHPTSADCPLASVACGDLGYFMETIQRYDLTGAAGEGPGDLGTALADCLERAQAKQVTCNGAGGAGGEGGQAGHGGQAGGGGQSGAGHN